MCENQMKTIARSVLPLVAAAVVLGFVPAIMAHDDETAGANMDMDMDTDMIADAHLMAQEQEQANDSTYPPTYFALPDHRVQMLAHFALMILAYVFMLPLAVMFSLARSRYALFAQFLFLATNAMGLLFATIYNSGTPDLYPNNAHHKIGWIITWVVSAQAIIGLLARMAGAMKAVDSRPRSTAERCSLIPVSRENMVEHQRQSENRFAKLYNRFSNDSGQGTEPNTESLRSHPDSPSGSNSPPIAEDDKYKEEYLDDADDEGYQENFSLPFLSRSTRVNHAFVRKAASLISSRVWGPMMLVYNFIDRTSMVFGFIALTTGIIAWGRFFEGGEVFTGLAHWIKGGIFFWMGLLTLARWSGSFGDLGWAWNLRPRSVNRKWCPSAEFVESFLIFLYGSTNVFLEHLGNAGQDFSEQDLEHISITVLFIGGGLCGMLIESTFVRDLLNTTVVATALEPAVSYQDEDRDNLRPPSSYEFSINPIPALVIMLLGIMMGSHTQQEMVSTMVHKQWGNLMTGAAFARGFSYVLMYIKPPKSIFPSRPPTELLTAFGLMSGGIIFMISSGDTVRAILHYGLNEMTLYTITLGGVGLLMAWVIVCLAVKGWAVRKEAGRSFATSFRMV